MQNYLKKAISLVIMAITLVMLYPIKASAEWKQNNVGWWYSEGNSWATGWKEISGNWYYFNEDGYMTESKLVDNYNYFVDSTGKWINSINNEINEYSKMLKNKKSLEQYDNIKSDFIDENGVSIIDIDKDGIYEMIVDSGSSMSNMAITVFKYENGIIYHETLYLDHTVYSGYDSSSKEFLLMGMQTGAIWAMSYKYENNKCIEVDSMEGSLIRDTYSLNGKSISKSDLENKFLNRFNVSIANQS